jgi:Na+-translocating ferredoxin:NAD+ oxidoreductase subunit B
MTGIILAAVVVGGTGLFIGVFLGIAGKKFAVKVDEREEAILGVLPGNNCGGCGYAGCSGLAAAIVKGEAEVSGCPVDGDALSTTCYALGLDEGLKLIRSMDNIEAVFITDDNMIYKSSDSVNLITDIDN